MPLIDRSDSLLVAVDAQPGFSGPGDDADAARARDVAAWLVGVAAALGVPVIVTEEDPSANGPTHPAIAARLPTGTPILAKSVFNLVDQADILAAVDATGRRTAILIGVETDVCVAQSAIGLRDRGFRVVVMSDATFPKGEMHDHGLAHVRDAGIEVRHAKGVYYEWVRTVAAARAFEAEHPDLARPPGFSL